MFMVNENFNLRVLQDCRKAQKDLARLRASIDKCITDGSPSGIKTSKMEDVRSTNMPMAAMVQHSECAQNRLKEQAELCRELEKKSEKLLNFIKTKSIWGIMYRYYIMGDSNEEISGDLSLSESSIRQLRKKARNEIVGGMTRIGSMTEKC